MNYSNKWFVAVTAGKWQKHGIKQAKALGLKILAIDADSGAEAFEDADHIVCMGFDNPNAIIEELRQLDLNLIGAVSFCSEAGMMLAARIREEFDLPGVNPKISERLLDKGIQRELLTKRKVPGPEWIVFDDKTTALKLLSAFPAPFIIKPTDSSGSRGVTKIEDSISELEDAVSTAFKYSRSGKVIAESYMEGTEFTVEVFVIEGKVNVLAVTEKKKVEGTRGTVASELATPDRPKEALTAIKNAAIDAFVALEFTDGPGHAEVILMDDNKVGIVEIAGRGGGFMVFDKFVPSVSGVNISKLTILQAIGIKVEINEVREFAGVLRFFPSKPGTVFAISGFGEASKLEGVEAEPFVKIGDKVGSAVSDGDRMGYIFSCADTVKAAKDLADHAERLIQFDIV